MKRFKSLFIASSLLLFSACVTYNGGPQPPIVTGPGNLIKCPNGTSRQLLTCDSPIKQIAKGDEFTLRFTALGGIGLEGGSKNILIPLVTGTDETARAMIYRYDLCERYNKCIISEKYYNDELRWLFTRREKEDESRKVDLNEHGTAVKLNFNNGLGDWVSIPSSGTIATLQSGDGKIVRIKSSFRGDNFPRIQKKLPGKHINGKNIRVNATIKVEEIQPGPIHYHGGHLDIEITNSDNSQHHCSVYIKEATDWAKQSLLCDIPTDAKNAVLRIGLQGSTGIMYCSDVEVFIPDDN